MPVRYSTNFLTRILANSLVKLDLKSFTALPDGAAAPAPFVCARNHRDGKATGAESRIPPTCRQKERVGYRKHQLLEHSLLDSLHRRSAGRSTCSAGS